MTLTFFLGPLTWNRPNIRCLEFNEEKNNRFKCKKNIYEKVMLGEMPSLLVSSNIVDRNIARAAVMTGNTNMYKNEIPIPPFIMQDDTLG